MRNLQGEIIKCHQNIEKGPRISNGMDEKKKFIILFSSKWINEKAKKKEILIPFMSCCG